MEYLLGLCPSTKQNRHLLCPSVQGIRLSQEGQHLNFVALESTMPRIDVNRLALLYGWDIQGVDKEAPLLLPPLFFWWNIQGKVMNKLTL